MTQHTIANGEPLFQIEYSDNYDVINSEHQGFWEWAVGNGSIDLEGGSLHEEGETDMEESKGKDEYNVEDDDGDDNKEDDEEYGEEEN
jgi:hypothetical protein